MITCYLYARFTKVIPFLWVNFLPLSNLRIGTLHWGFPSTPAEGPSSQANGVAPLTRSYHYSPENEVAPNVLAPSVFRVEQGNSWWLCTATDQLVPVWLYHTIIPPCPQTELHKYSQGATVELVSGTWVY